MALSRHHAALSRPLNVQEIVSEASDFEFSTSRSLLQWLRSAKMLLAEAAMCEQDGNLQKAYLYTFRHAELILSKLPEHPDYRDPKYADDLAQARKALQKNLVKLEKWRPRINQEYQRYALAMERRNAERRRARDEYQESEQRRRRSSQQTQENWVDPESPASFDSTQALKAHENRQLAVELAHREIQRRNETKGAPSVARRSSNDGVKVAGDLMNRQSQAKTFGPVFDGRIHTPTYQYPSVPAKENAMEWNRPAVIPSSSTNRDAMPPALPAKEGPSHHGISELADTPPPVPQRPDISAPPRPTSTSPAQPSRYTFQPSASTESGAPLRTMLLPPKLRSKFLNLADANTARNIETCGILCGTVVSNALFITHLVLPEQVGNTDTCETTADGDSALFAYCDAQSLLVCGWIHTHPSQSCFLSSRDLHTSAGYQIMLPEAIAIVCAPRFNPDCGIFRLTEPPGLEHVLACHRPGTFHPHDQANLYTDALRPGHVIEGPGLEFEVVDLRK